jgi:hypothetical protein
MKKTITYLLYAMFASIFLLDGFFGEGNANTGLHLIPKKLSYLTEILSLVTALCVLIIYALQKRLCLRKAYLLFFFFYIMHAVAGIVLNTVSSGAIIAGIRRYYAFLPFFFLPMTYKFNDSEISTQLKILLFFGIIQCPLVIFQRFIFFRNFYTGDFITGTLGTSSILSIYLIVCITILTAFYIKKKIKLSSFLLLSLILFIPTTLNETKGTIVLFPISIMITILFGTGRIISLKKIVLVIFAGSIIIFIFIPIYNLLYPRTDIERFYQGGGKKTSSFEGYLYKGLSKDDVDENEPGRIDAFLFPFKILANEPFKLLIGLGIGNVNESGISSLRGEYTNYVKYGANMITAASLIWETGLIGLFLHIVFLWIVLRDALALRAIDNVIGNFAIGWISVIVILAMSFFYKNIFHLKVIVYLFWYFSGLVASKRAEYEATNFIRSHLQKNGSYA